MSLSTEIQYCSKNPQLPASEAMSWWADKAFGAVLKRDAEVTIRIVDEEEGAELNRKYRNGVGATNVLAFNYAEDSFAQSDLLGDVIICAPIVMQEALSQGKSIDAHWAHMVVHGILHLCGYKHSEEKEALSMEKLETEILSELGFPAPYN